MSENKNKTSDNFISVSDLLFLCIARWRWFVGSILVCMLFSFYLLSRAPRLYTRSATIMVNEEGMGKSTANGGSEFEQLGFVKQKDNMQNVVRHIMSLDMLMEVAHRLDSTLQGDALIFRASDIQDGLTVEAAGSQSTIIDLSYRDYSVDDAEKVLTLVLEVYNDKYLEYKRIMTQNTSRFIDTRLVVLKRDLDIVDDSIALYKSSYGITDLEHVSDIYLRQQSESDAAIMKLNSQKQMAEFIRDLLEEDSQQHQLLLVNSGIDNSLIESQITLYNNLLLELQNHLKYTSEQNPLVIHQEEQIASLRSKILTNITNHIHSIDIQMDQLIDFHNEVTEKVTSNPAQAKYLATIERERNVKESLYLFLLQKKEENDISLTYQAEHAQVIDIPHGSYKPTSPKSSKYIFGGFFLGFLIPITVLFLRITLSETINNHHDIERHPDIRFLGEVPMSERTSTMLHLQRFLGLKPKGGGIVVAQGKTTPINEAFRLIRTKLTNATDKLGGINGVYMVTSDQTNAGKTFISTNLAMVLAIAGKRVLLIDGDLRKASATKLWKTGNAGLTDYLEGRENNIASLIVQQESISTLSILPAGAIPSTPTELLMTPLLRNLIEQVRPSYDIILVDTPPIGRLADAEIIGKNVDRQLFILRAGLHKRTNLTKLEAAEDSNGKQLFVILNGINIDFRYDRIATSRFFDFKNPFKFKKA